MISRQERCDDRRRQTNERARREHIVVFDVPERKVETRLDYDTTAKEITVFPALPPSSSSGTIQERPVRIPLHPPTPSAIIPGQYVLYTNGTLPPEFAFRSFHPVREKRRFVFLCVDLNFIIGKQAHFPLSRSLLPSPFLSSRPSPSLLLSSTLPYGPIDQTGFSCSVFLHPLLRASDICARKLRD